MNYSTGGAPAVRRGFSVHHTPDFCTSCGEKLIRYRSRHLELEFWWCRTCRSATVCACEGCEVLRALTRDYNVEH